jgi:pimeloyl-ACP methyl ester carboxylesterase
VQSVQTEELHLEVGQETLAATRILATPAATPTVVSFHGTGPTAHQGTIRYVLDHLVTHGVSSACFDFSGHGGSTGQAGVVDLEVRTREAFEAATSLCPPSPAAIIGTSMGGYLAAVLSPRLSARTLVLFAPLAYSWDGAESPAFTALRRFSGKLLIIAGRNDESVGEGIIDGFVRSAPDATSRVILLDDCGHRVHPWLREHDQERAMVLSEIAAVIR